MFKNKDDKRFIEIFKEGSLTECPWKFFWTQRLALIIYI